MSDNMSPTEIPVFAIRQVLGLTEATTTVHARHNLLGAYLDLQRAGADPICLKTIDRVMTQLAAVEEILEEAEKGRFPRL